MTSVKAKTEQLSSTTKLSRFLARAHLLIIACWSKYFTQRDQFQAVRSPRLILSLLLFGSLAVMAVLFALLITSFVFAGNHYLLSRILWFCLVFVYLFGILALRRNGRIRLASFLLVGLYGLIALLILWYWSINAPVGILLLGFVIVLTGITLGSRYIVLTTGVIIAALAAIQLVTKLGLHQPDRTSLILTPTFGDVATYAILFLILALVSWLSGRQMERALSEARQAESDLLAEKKLLAMRLKERTIKLRSAQFKEMQQLYRFAELGQLSTALLHDLSNHLTILTMDIEDFERQRHSQAIERAKQSMVYLDDLVDQVRRQLREDSSPQTFDCIHSLKIVTDNLRPRAHEHKVQVTITYSDADHKINFFGDKTRFEQVFTILVSNAIDAAAETTELRNRKVLVNAKVSRQAVVISVKDWGPGIPTSKHASLFKPFHSNKKGGMGIGLFIAKQLTATHFKASLSLQKSSNPTTFVVTIPLRIQHAPTLTKPPTQLRPNKSE